MNIKVITRNVGYALLVSALFMLLSVVVSLLRGNDSALAALLISFIITFTVGIFPFIFVRKTPAISLQDGYMIIFLSWLLSFVFGMMPYLLWGGPFTVVNAWFESVSGFTTTGGTILDNIEALPDSLLFWRSSTHFIGGLGVVVFLLLIIPSSSPVRLRLTNMELSSLSRDGYRTTTNKTVLIFAWVYLAMNLAAFICYLLAGMSPFDAINHAFSVCATGGFSTKNLSIGAFHSNVINLITIFFMLMSSTHFAILYMVVVTRSLSPLNNPVLKYYFATLATLSILVAMSLKYSQVDMTWGKAFMDGVFQVVCYASTTGFAITDNSTWPFFACVLLMFAGIQCGMAGSTTGGLKSDRIMILFKSIAQHVKRSIHPNSVTGIRMGRQVLSDEDVYPHILYIALYASLVIIAFGFCLWLGADGEHALAGTVASVSNLGPAFGEIGTYGSYNAEPTGVKLVYTACMFLGRLEIYPVLVVFSLIFSRNKKF
ncbi:MAG: TrkH family potassium uptake protein [Bacteroidales bacterium]|nr:TrkH family potassium uptake protein [Bacteroidales bacterium]